MRIINKKYLLIILLIGIILTGAIVFKPRQEVELDNVILKQEVNNKTFAMYKEEGESYVPVEGTKFPEGYVLNVNESKCIDNNGNELNGILSYENSEVVLTTNKSSYCYLYFDKSAGLKIIESNPTNLNVDQAGMYRYQGSKDEVNNNYICFGTSDKDTCLANQDKYMYRIIGITNNGEFKLIKKEPLPADEWNDIETTEYSKNEDGTLTRILRSADIKWQDSELFKRLNGLTENDNIFIGNEKYDYLSQDNWINKIQLKKWPNGSMKYGDPHHDPENVYNIEIGKSKLFIYKEEDVVKYNNGNPINVLNDESLIKLRNENEVKCQNTTDNTAVTCYSGKQETFTDDTDGALIGLMYIHDYYYSVQQNGFDCHYHNIIENVELQELCKSSWLFIRNNSNLSLDEWLIGTREFMIYDNMHLAWYINAGTGHVGGSEFSHKNVSRPVFYLKNTITLKENTDGTIDNPYIINIT